MAARALVTQGYHRPSGGYVLPNLAVIPPAGDAALNWAFSVFYVTDGSNVPVPHYMPYLLLIEQASISAPAAGQATLGVKSGTDQFVAILSNGETASLIGRTQGFSPGLLIDDTNNPGWFQGLRVNGTDASPTKLLSGDRILRVGAGGPDAAGTVRFDRAVIDYEAISDWNSTTDTGTQIVLKTCADDSGTLVQGLLQKGAGHLYDRDNRRIIGRLGSDLFSSGIFVESLPRWAVVAFSGMITGQVMYTLIHLEAGDIVSNLAWRSIGAAATLTHQISGLYDSSGNRLAQSSDATSAAWGANSTKTFAMSAPYTVLTTGVYWAALRVSATTMPTMAGVNPNTTFQSAAFAQAFHDSNTDTAATTVPATVGTKTGDGPLWVGVS